MVAVPRRNFNSVASLDEHFADSLIFLPMAISLRNSWVDQRMKAVIETTHLLLRPWQEDDLDPLVRLLAKPEVAHYIRLDGQVGSRIGLVMRITHWDDLSLLHYPRENWFSFLPGGEECATAKTSEMPGQRAV